MEPLPVTAEVSEDRGVAKQLSLEECEHALGEGIDAHICQELVAVCVEQPAIGGILERRYLSQESMAQLRKNAARSVTVALAKSERRDDCVPRSSQSKLHHSANLASGFGIAQMSQSRTKFLLRQS